MTLNLAAIDAAMTRKGIRSNSQLARRAGVLPATLCNARITARAGGDTGLEIIQAIARALGVRVIDIADSPYLRCLRDPGSRQRCIPHDSRHYREYVRRHPHHEEDTHYGT